MADDANVFNTFSFNKWADKKKEEEIDAESRRRRAEQVKRLKDRLKRERELRLKGMLNARGGDGDLDLDALIQAIQQQQPEGNPYYDPYYGENAEPEIDDGLSHTEYVAPREMTDDEVLAEIQRFGDDVSRGRKGGAVGATMQAIIDDKNFKYNRRFAQEQNSKYRKPATSHARRSNTPVRVEHRFHYNRIVTK